MITQIRPLTQEERQLARSAAQEAVMRDIGERPIRSQYNHHTAYRYPPMVTRLITGLCIALLLAAFTPSAIRLYVIGSSTFGAAVPYELAMIAVGIATVLTAEVGQVVFSLALATLGTSTSARRLLYSSMGIATAIALVGNVQIALPGHMRKPVRVAGSDCPAPAGAVYRLRSQRADARSHRTAPCQRTRLSGSDERLAAGDGQSRKPTALDAVLRQRPPRRAAQSEQPPHVKRLKD